MRISDWSSDVCSSDLRSSSTATSSRSRRATSWSPRPARGCATSPSASPWDSSPPTCSCGRGGGASSSSLSVVVPIAANGIRAYGIILLAHPRDYRLAVHVDHVLYGLDFLIIVTLLLLGLLVPLRARASPDGAGRSHPATHPP